MRIAFGIPLPTAIVVLLNTFDYGICMYAACCSIAVGIEAHSYKTAKINFRLMLHKTNPRELYIMTDYMPFYGFSTTINWSDYFMRNK